MIVPQLDNFSRDTVPLPWGYSSTCKLCTGSQNGRAAGVLSSSPLCLCLQSVRDKPKYGEREREREREETANVVICIGPSFMWVWMALQHFSKFLKIVFTKFKIDFEHTQ